MAAKASHQQEQRAQYAWPETHKYVVPSGLKHANKLADSYKYDTTGV
jgi:hypothetical protein